MENAPELNIKHLGTFTQDFATASETLKEASYQLRVRKISEFPIFPICKEEMSVGSLLIPKEELNTKWNFNISFLNEFEQRQLITEEGLEEFKKSYKDPEEFCCLFVVDAQFTNFVYIPYPVDDENTPLD